jgi:hypothetical protein
MHVYLVEEGGQRNIVDFANNTTHEGPSFLEEADVVTGFAYDPFTDHFFLRLAPGNQIRVVDRPAQAIKREFAIDGLAVPSAGDMAVRPRDGHLFLLQENGRAVAEASRLGKMIRTFPFTPTSTEGVAIALDPKAEQFFVLHSDGRRITIHDLTGRQSGEVTLEQRAGKFLGFDAEKNEFYTTSADGAATFLVFTREGRLKSAYPLPLPTAFIDIGPRSFVRVF